MADEIIVLPPRSPKSFRMNFYATFQDRLERSRALFLAEHLLSLRRMYPKDTPERLKDRLQVFETGWRREIDKGRTANEELVQMALSGILGAVDIGADLHPGVSVASKSMAAARDLSNQYWLGPQWELAARKNQWLQTRYFDWHGDRILNEVRERGIDDRDFQDALVQYVPQLGDPWKEDPAILLKTKPNVPDWVKQLVQSDGSITIAIGELRGAMGGYFTELKAQGDAALGMLGTVLTNQDALLAHAAKVEDRWKAQDQKELEQAQVKELMEGISGGISIVSTLIGIADPKLGRDTAKFLEGTVQLTQGLISLAGSAGNPLGMLAAGSQILGAVMGMTELFGPEQQTPDQMILQGIGELQQQVGTLRAEMHGRLDVVDRKLDGLFQLVGDGFFMIDWRLGKIDARLVQVQREIHDALSAIRRSDLNVLDFFQDDKRLELRKALSSITWRDRTSRPMPPEDFIDYEEVLHRWATTECLSPIETNGSARSYLPHEIAGELARPLEGNLDYLNGWMAQQGLSRMSDGALPNVNTWSMSAGAVASMRSEWFEHAAPGGAERGADERALGEGLRAAFAKLTVVGPETVNSALWDRLTNNYKAAVGDLDGALLQAEGDFLGERNVALKYPLDRPRIDPFGGAGQPPVLARPTVQTDDELPLTVLASIPNAILLAEYFMSPGVTEFALVVEGSWVDVERDETFGSRAWWAVFEASLLLSYRGIPVESLFIRRPRIKLNTVPDARSWLKTRWPSFRSDFEGGQADDILSGDDFAGRKNLYVGVGDEMTRRLGKMQMSMASALTGKLLDSLRTRGSTLDGAKALIRDFLLLGLPRAMAADGYLQMFLDGQPALHDHDAVVAEYVAASATAPPAERHPNPRARIREDAEKRAEALRNVIYGYLDMIRLGTHQEWHEALELVLRLSRVSSKLTTPEALAALPAAPPTRLIAATGPGRVSLDWAENAELDLIGYRIYRKDGAQAWGEVGDVPESAYVDTAVAPNVNYSYRVTALDTSPAGESDPSSVVSVDVPGPPVNAGLPTVSGPAAVGQILTAAPGTWSGTLPISCAYQWRRVPAGGGPAMDIAGATGSTYTPVAADAGSSLAVAVTATNRVGSATALSGPRAVTAPPANTALPTIAGSAVVGQGLTAAPGAWSGTAPITLAYQWRRIAPTGAAVDIANATGQTYVLVAGDVESTVQVVVRATNPAGWASAASARSAAVTAPPANTALPTIAGSAVVGQGLTAAPGAWSGTAPITLAYQWRRIAPTGAAVDIANATGQTYVLVAGDVGSTVQVVVRATNPAGWASAASARTAVVIAPATAPRNTSPPTITGEPYVGEVLRAGTGAWSGTPAPSFTYQWLRCDAAGQARIEIPGATGSTYVPQGGEIVMPESVAPEADLVLPNGDVGSTLRVVVTAVNPGGRSSATSAATAPIAVSEHPPPGETPD